MNAAHLHLILVHIPVVLLPTATILLCLSLWRNQHVLAQTALSLFVVATLVCVPAFLIGEDAEELVEHQPGVVEDTIEEHEEAAERALWFTVAAGSLALLALITRKPLPGLQPTTLKILTVVGALASVTLGYTAFEGGKIRHPEAYPQDAAMDGEHAHGPEHDD
jgi:uncharacterized membrane protein